MTKRAIRGLIESVQEALAPAEFVQTDWDPDTLETLFVRRSATAGTYERLLCESDGLKYDVVGFEVQAGLTRGANSTRGLFERAIVPIPGHDDRGWSLVASGQDAERIAAAAGELVPRLAADLAEARGPGLLEKAWRARDLAEQVWDWLEPENEPVADLVRREASAQEREYAERMRYWPAVMCVRGAEEIYETAALALLRFGPRNSGASTYLGADPMRDAELNQVLQLIVDRLRFGPPGTWSRPESEHRTKRKSARGHQTTRR